MFHLFCPRLNLGGNIDIPTQSNDGGMRRPKRAILASLKWEGGRGVGDGPGNVPGCISRVFQ